MIVLKKRYLSTETCEKTNEAFDNVWKEAEDTGNIFLGSKVEIQFDTRSSNVDIQEAQKLT